MVRNIFIIAILTSLFTACGFMRKDQKQATSHNPFLQEKIYPTFSPKSPEDHKLNFDTEQAKFGNFIEDYLNKNIKDKSKFVMPDPSKETLEKKIELYDKEVDQLAYIKNMEVALKAKFLNEISKYPDLIKNLTSLLSISAPKDFSYFMNKIKTKILRNHNDTSCSYCSKVNSILNTLKQNNPKIHQELGSKFIHPNKSKYLCPKCKFFQKTLSFIRVFNNLEVKKTKTTITIKNLRDLITSDQEKYHEINPENEFYKIEKKYRRLNISDNRDEKEFLTKYFDFVTQELPRLNNQIKRISKYPSDEELETNNMNYTQTRNSFLKLQCKKCNKHICNIHLLYIKQILKNIEASPAKNKEIETLKNIFELDEHIGLAQNKVVLAPGNKQSEKFYVNKSKCPSCLLEEKTDHIIKSIRSIQ